MNDLQRSGGIASLIMAGTFIIGVLVFALLLLDSDYFADDPAQVIGFLAQHQALLSAWHLIIYVGFGIALVALTVTLHERLQQQARSMMLVASAFGVIWSGLVIASGMIAVVGMGSVVDLHATNPEQAAAAWVAIEAVQFGIGGGVEIVGALWVLLVNWSALRTEQFPRWLSYLGITIGVAGILTIAPPLAIFGAVFGIGLIVWFTWMGLVLLRGHVQPQVNQDAASLEVRREVV